MQLDAVIFGGGAAGLWLLDELSRRGCAALLLEAHALGHGQTVASQGIIHGGLKYTLRGKLTSSATHIREMPRLWRDCLAGRREPDLQGTALRAEFCYLWRTDSVRSRLGMLGAQFGLQATARALQSNERPALLADCPGTVARLEEQVIDPASLLGVFAERQRSRILRIDPERVSFQTSNSGTVSGIRLVDPESGGELKLSSRHLVLTAGAGNAKLRQELGLAASAMQRRPLHMVLLRGDLPPLNGHCVDGGSTRVTITADVDAHGQTVWQVGGRLAEEGVARNTESQIAHARSELESAIPGLNLSAVEWATCRVDRAEGATPTGGRPESVRMLRESNVLTAWPTKLALVPELSQQITAEIEPNSTAEFDESELADWPRPQVAAPPWDAAMTWHRLDADNRFHSDAA